MNTKTIVLLSVAVIAIGGGYYLYQKKKATSANQPPAPSNGNPDQRSAADAQVPQGEVAATINAGVSALNALEKAFGGW